MVPCFLGANVFFPDSLASMVRVGVLFYCSLEKTMEHLLGESPY